VESARLRRVPAAAGRLPRTERPGLAARLLGYLPGGGEKGDPTDLFWRNARSLGRVIAIAVGKQAIQDGQAQVADEDALIREVDANIWEPVYVPYEHK